MDVTGFDVVVDFVGLLHVGSILNLAGLSKPKSLQFALDYDAHFNTDKTESNLSVPAIQGCRENTLCKSFETSPI